MLVLVLSANSNSTTSLLSGGEEGGGCSGRAPYLSDVNISNIASDGGLHSRSGGTQPELNVESSVDSGHGGTGRSRCGGKGGALIEAEVGEHPSISPLVFDPLHFSVCALCLIIMFSINDSTVPAKFHEILCTTVSIIFFPFLEKRGRNGSRKNWIFRVGVI